MSDIDTPEGRAELRRLAEAATPGPWRDHHDPTGEDVEVWSATSRAGGGTFVAYVGQQGFHGTDADAAYIAAANPQTVLALLDRLRAAEDWKAQALTVLAEWETTWEAVGMPGRLGQSKAQAVREAFSTAQMHEHSARTWTVRAEDAEAERDRLRTEAEWLRGERFAWMERVERLWAQVEAVRALAEKFERWPSGPSYAVTARAIRAALDAT